MSEKLGQFFQDVRRSLRRNTKVVSESASLFGDELRLIGRGLKAAAAPYGHRLLAPVERKSRPPKENPLTRESWNTLITQKMVGDHVQQFMYHDRVDSSDTQITMSKVDEKKVIFFDERYLFSPDISLAIVVGEHSFSILEEVNGQWTVGDITDKTVQKKVKKLFEQVKYSKLKINIDKEKFHQTATEFTQRTHQLLAGGR